MKLITNHDHHVMQFQENQVLSAPARVHQCAVAVQIRIPIHQADEMEC